MYHQINPSIYGTNYNISVQQSYQYVQDIPFNNTTDAISSTTMQQRQYDESNIEAFLAMVEQSHELICSKAKRSASKISKSKDALASISKLNNELQTICAELKDNEELPEHIWQDKIETCNKLKEQILDLGKPFKDPVFLCQLQKDIMKRKKKRLREKIKREKWKNEKSKRAERRLRMHAEIDSWIRKEQAVIEKEKQDQNLRRDADIILSDVRGKRNDTKKYLGVLEELKHLRNVKANIAKARGEHLSSVADEAFNSIIDKLEEQWLVFDREYSLEEQGLKLMLKTDNEEIIEKQKKNIFDEWENVLFGRRILNADHAKPDLHTFVVTRSAWDKFVSIDPDATPIPIGWVLPEKPSSAAWQKYLEKQT